MSFTTNYETVLSGARNKETAGSKSSSPDDPKEIEFPEKPQPEHLVLHIELVAAFQKIPQRYCVLCKAKTSLSMAFNFVKAAKQD